MLLIFYRIQKRRKDQLREVQSRRRKKNLRKSPEVQQMSTQISFKFAY
jgi:hypothetical protein